MYIFGVYVGVEKNIHQRNATNKLNKYQLSTTFYESTFSIRLHIIYHICTYIHPIRYIPHEIFVFFYFRFSLNFISTFCLQKIFKNIIDNAI